MMLTRRFILAAAAATAAASALPAAVAAAPKMPPVAATPVKWFLVGDEDRCEFIRARTEADAIREWIVERAGQEHCDAVERGQTPPEECECHPCCVRASVMSSYHVERLDGQEDVAVTEYWAEGLGIFCSSCDGLVTSAGDGEVVDGECICNDCLDAVKRRAERQTREAVA